MPIAEQLATSFNSLTCIRRSSPKMSECMDTVDNANNLDSETTIPARCSAAILHRVGEWLPALRLLLGICRALPRAHSLSQIIARHESDLELSHQQPLSNRARS